VHGEPVEHAEALACAHTHEVEQQHGLVGVAVLRVRVALLLRVQQVRRGRAVDVRLKQLPLVHCG
jgi:hypothetical protein